MITKLVQHEKAIRSTALSFAVMGTIMHGLNVMHATNSTISHAWSIVAIIGFFLTVANFVNKRPLFEASKIKKWHNRQHNPQQNSANPVLARDDVSLP